MYTGILLPLCIQYHCTEVSTEIQQVQFNITALIRVPFLPESDSLRTELSGNRIKVGGEIFFTLPARPLGPPTFLYNGYRVSYPAVKRPGRGVDHTPISSVEVKERVQLYIYIYLGGLHVLFQGDLYLTYLYMYLSGARRHWIQHLLFLRLFKSPAWDVVRITGAGVAFRKASNHTGQRKQRSRFPFHDSCVLAVARVGVRQFCIGLCFTSLHKNQPKS